MVRYFIKVFGMIGATMLSCLETNNRSIMALINVFVEVLDSANCATNFDIDWMACFDLKFSSTRSLSYLDFPESFVWGITKREWNQRLKGHVTTIDLLYSAHPGEGGRFYLKILSNHVTVIF